MPALPRLPGLAQAIDLATSQARALAQLPRILLDLNRSILGLIESLNSARETMATVAVVTARLERVAEELEGPILSLRPGLERLARILDDPVVDTIPDIVRTINDDVVPLLQGLRDTQSRVNALATVLPGASLLFSRRPPRPGSSDTTIIESEEN